MKYAIRALGWATAILLILVIAFSVTVVYSAMQIRMNFAEGSRMTTSQNAVTMSLPFSISNGGFYDISELNITTRIAAENELVIARSTTLVPLIPKDGTVDETHNITLSLDDILAKNLTYLLFNDTDVNVDMFVALMYAHAISLKISSNLTMPWGAPLYNLTVKEISIVSPNQVNVSLGSENHAFFSLDGTVRLEIVDGLNNQIGSGTADIFVSPGSIYDDVISVTITGVPSDVKEVRLYFDTSVFRFGPVVIALE